MTASTLLRLPTPGEVPEGGEAASSSSHSHDAETDDQRAYRLSRAFGFPYPQAYTIQLELMAQIFRTIEDGKVGVFESPTGTGKSLSLICSAFTWLRQNQERAARGQVESIAQDAGDEPEWVVQHRQDKVRRELMAQQDELKARIRAARAKQAEWKRSGKKAAESGAADDSQHQRKRLKRDQGADADDSDDDFLASDTEADPADGAGGSSRRRAFGFLGARASKRAQEDQYDNLSPQVRALMAQLDATKNRQGAGGGPDDDDEEPETLPRIIYASRTHSQLSQFVAELRKTDFGKRIKVTSHWDEDREGGGTGKTATLATKTKVGTASDDDQDIIEPIRTISLGSRKQMCINADVQKLGQRAGAEAMNERCLELLKSSTSSGGGGDGDGRSKKRCSFAPPPDEVGRAQVLEFRDHAMAEVTDIEDLVQLGRDMKTCPYFAARSSARQAELITLPYNLLLQKDARQSLGISFEGCVVLIDEAHNLIDNILSTHTVSISSEQVGQAARQIQTYLDRFALRLKGSNEAHLRQMMGVLNGLQGFCTKWLDRRAGQGKSPAQSSSVGQQEIMTASQLVAEIGGTLDRINLVELERWLKDTQIARKVSGYADKQVQKQRRDEIAASIEESKRQRRTAKGAKAVPTPPLTTTTRSSDGEGPSPIAAMHAIESFILSLANRTEDGRVLLGLQPPRSRSALEPSSGGVVATAPSMTLKYQLLNPSHVFKTLVEEARSVVLAGGTMEPISDFRQQLVPSLAAERFTSHSCGHIIPSSNLSVTVVSSGPRGVPFEFKFDNRKDPALLDELGATLVNLCNIVPDGLVVFLPSYAFLDTVMERWKTETPASSSSVIASEIASATTPSTTTTTTTTATTTSVWKRIEAKKRIFVEPKTTREVDAVLRDYTLEIDAPRQGRIGGAVLFAVVGAKLSEGINFSDQLARAVAMVGMPFPNAHSPELAERVRYVRELAKKDGGGSSRGDAGNELYTNLCMKAVNQSIGRAIRHKDDYASLLLLDRRYGRRDILERLPKWIGKEAVVAERFGSVAQRNGAFFRSKAAAAKSKA
ncbi:uncharacterized protein PFL1_05505 [Pseudozyma flocculosa PF-1]|uniref:ATP-dependent DNA helicase CHL1 n=1 Tax=Pseudozyma flocculosa PF-1 TaxID=1277687 RepID=A0A061H4I2_9BASI|nr:uncharacterized protein PFL1_05505 [Pseudozyma flocculosa PF-1]EPQ26870.1 hypothetical protein PFL1_05505 [Pseudozyma flocculosa PF-1]